MRIQVNPGIIKPVFELIKDMPMNKTDRVCVLSFDGMKVRKEYAFDISNQQTLPASNYVQVVMVRGLFCHWKQPIYYAFYQKMTKKIIFEIIVQLSDINFDIVALVSDLGPTNRGLWKELNIDENMTSFVHPCDENKTIFVSLMYHILLN